MKKLFAFVLCALLIFSFAACGESQETVKLSFKAASSYEDLKALDGKTVSINGYMATSSPVDGGYLFLMNLPSTSAVLVPPPSTPTK